LVKTLPVERRVLVIVAELLLEFFKLQVPEFIPGQIFDFGVPVSSLWIKLHDSFPSEILFVY
jgi:hypothetical protein